MIFTKEQLLSPSSFFDEALVRYELEGLASDETWPAFQALLKSAVEGNPYHAHPGAWGFFEIPATETEDRKTILKYQLGAFHACMQEYHTALSEACQVARKLNRLVPKS